MFFARQAGMKYIDRGDKAGPDWIDTGLTLDGAYNVLDLSGIVGVGRRFVSIRLRINETVGGKYCDWRTDGNSNTYNVERRYTQVANKTHESGIWLWTSAEGKVQYNFNVATWNSITVVIRGWFKLT